MKIVQRPPSALIPALWVAIAMATCAASTSARPNAGGVPGTIVTASTYTLVTQVVGAGAVARDPDLAAYDSAAVVQLQAAPDNGFRFVGWSGDASGSSSETTVVMNANRQVTATFVEAIAPSVQVLAPNGGQRWNLGQSVQVQWTASDAAPGVPASATRVTAVDVLLSRNGPAGPFASLATGLPNSGSYAWTVAGPTTSHAWVRVIARDSASNAATDQSDARFVIQETPVPFIINLRADSALGSGPPNTPSNNNPWVDLAGGHNANLSPDFYGTPAGGWNGDGTPANPYRIEFQGEEQGANTRVTIPAGSVPELQTIGPVSAAVWFKTGFGGAQPLRYDYVLEWVQHPRPDWDPEYEGRGMSIMVENGKLQVYANPWIEVTTVEPNSWYHVVVVKDTNDMRIYVNGQRLHTGIKSHRGIQQSEIVLGCATFRVFEGFQFPYSDFGTGAVAQVQIAAAPMTDNQVRTLFEADSALYLPQSEPPLERVLWFRANAADGDSAYPSPGNTSPWVDLTVHGHDGALSGFDGTAASGWSGAGTPGSPSALVFDGIDDQVVVPANSIAELQNVSAYSVEMWARLGPDILTSSENYLMEWLAGVASSAGMSLMAADGKLQVFTGNPFWKDVMPITPDVWYHIAAVKEPGEVRVYVNGVLRFSALTPHIGDQESKLMLGASIWRGAESPGDFMQGAIGSFSVWRGALSDSAVFASYAADSQFAFGVAGLTSPSRDRGPQLSLAGLQPNPARGRLRVAFSLAQSAPASIELIDVSGRRLRRRDLPALEAGRHVVDLGHASGLEAGVYFLKLSQGGVSRTAKATLVR